MTTAIIDFINYEGSYSQISTHAVIMPRSYHNTLCGLAIISQDHFAKLQR